MKSIEKSVAEILLKNEDENKEQIPNTIPLSIGGRLSYAPGNQKLLYALNFKGTGKYNPQEFDPASGDYQSSDISVKSYLIIDAQIIYNITPSYRFIFGTKNIGNHTNLAYGPYIGRTAYIELNTNHER